MEINEVPPEQKKYKLVVTAGELRALHIALSIASSVAVKTDDWNQKYGMTIRATSADKQDIFKLDSAVYTFLQTGR